MTEYVSPIEQERQHAGFHRQLRAPGQVEESARTPDAVKEAALGHQGAMATLEKAQGRGVEWVRPTDLIARQFSRLAGRGLDLHTELARRTRTAAHESARQVAGRLGERARRLPPASAFGHRGAQPGPMRPGVGMR
jgi:hypothetical protein